MKSRRAALVIIVLALVSAAAVLLAHPEPFLSLWHGKDEWRFTPDPTSKTGVYVPADLVDAMKELDRAMPNSEQRAMRQLFRVQLSDFHFGLGLTLRNNWGLSHESRLARYFESNGVSHPDDMSAIIVAAYFEHLHGRPIDPKEYLSQRAAAPTP
jgi:hypothetical protein